MSERYITLVGCQHYFGSEILKVGQELRLKKDHENNHDEEAIQVDLPSVGKVGYVANSHNTVAKGTQSAGRLYDTFEEECRARIVFIVKGTAIVRVLLEGEA